MSEEQAPEIQINVKGEYFTVYGIRWAVLTCVL